MLDILNESIKTIDLLLKNKQDIKVRIQLIKNKKRIIELVELIIDTHNSILQAYATFDDNGKAIFSSEQDKMKSLTEIANMTKNIKFDENITIFSYDEIVGLDELNNEQLESIIFMLEI